MSRENRYLKYYFSNHGQQNPIIHPATFKRGFGVSITAAKLTVQLRYIYVLLIAEIDNLESNSAESRILKNAVDHSCGDIAGYTLVHHKVS
jgi:hypothetical protein